DRLPASGARLRFRIVVLLSAGLTSSFAQTKTSEAGRELFRRNCSSCHGRQADGGSAPNLSRGSRDDAEVTRIISNGVPGTDMAAYGGRLSSADIARILTFLRGAVVNDAPSSGNAARGEALFWNAAGCGACHAVGSRGNLLGPDLTR